MKFSTSTLLKFSKTLSILLLLAIVAFGCQKEMIQPESDAPAAQYGGNPSLQRPLAQCGASVFAAMKAGPVSLGTVEMLNDASQLYMIFDMNNFKFIEQIKIYVGDLGQMPVDGAGNILVEAFPVQYQMGIPANEYTFTLANEDISTCNDIIVWARVSTRNIFGQVTSTVDTWMSGNAIANGFETPFCLTTCTAGAQNVNSVE